MKVRVLRHSRQGKVHLNSSHTHDQPFCRVIRHITPTYWCWDDWVELADLRMIEKSLCRNCVKNIKYRLGVELDWIR